MLVNGVSIRNRAEVDATKIASKMIFKGTVHGVDFEHNSTVEEIYAQFTRLYPDVVANAIIAERETDHDFETRSFVGQICCLVAGWGNHVYSRNAQN
ncbi:uncharacterized protein PAC_06830 [Phialocephala subalpina]|uniref:Uncharacterized protein n=1 Tax=Phialocephala subalpina TaxID=576137 RepID=A0A1L7WVX9_9HELO|nr:uncharacterized protein PAC_06830 [Phialocephala subalpina]